MKLLVLQHADCEHPGFFRGLLAEGGNHWVAVERVGKTANRIVCAQGWAPPTLDRPYPVC